MLPLTIDLQQGHLQLADYDLIVGPGLRQNRFLRSPLGQAANILWCYDSTDYRIFQLPTLTIAELHLFIQIVFRRGIVEQVVLFPDGSVRGGQRLTLSDCEAWLQQVIGLSTGEFNWGRLHAQTNMESGANEIIMWYSA